MRWLVWYIKSCFCKHEWKFEQNMVTTRYFDMSEISKSVVVSVTCLKCAYHKSYIKYDI